MFVNGFMILAHKFVPVITKDYVHLWSMLFIYSVVFAVVMTISYGSILPSYLRADASIPGQHYRWGIPVHRSFLRGQQVNVSVRNLISATIRSRDRRRRCVFGDSHSR